MPEASVVAPGPYTLGQSVLANYSCADEGASGLASCEGPVADGLPIDTASIGPKSFTVIATDKAGNEAQASNEYSVIYAFRGFLSPVDNPPVVNTLKAGQAVPVRFSLGGNQGLGVIEEVTSRPITCSPATCRGKDPLERISRPGASGLSYNRRTRRTHVYTFVWKTKKEWSVSCREPQLTLADGTLHTALFRLR